MKTILIVDDKRSAQRLVADYLSEKGFRTVAANNGREALFVARHENPDLVLLDIMMPEMDGYEAMKRIRAQERFKTVPMIALTAKAMKDDRSKCIEAGANDYCSKPVDMEKLTALMRVWLHKT